MSETIWCGGQQLPVADLVRIDIIGIAIQHAVGELGQFVMQLLGFRFEYSGVPRGSSSQGMCEPREAIAPAGGVAQPPVQLLHFGRLPSPRRGGHGLVGVGIGPVVTGFCGGSEVDFT
jgi:hypothetical protein